MRHEFVLRVQQSLSGSLQHSTYEHDQVETITNSTDLQVEGPHPLGTGYPGFEMCATCPSARTRWRVLALQDSREATRREVEYDFEIFSLCLLIACTNMV